MKAVKVIIHLWISEEMLSHLTSKLLPFSSHKIGNISRAISPSRRGLCIISARTIQPGIQIESKCYHLTSRSGLVIGRHQSFCHNEVINKSYRDW